MNGLSHWEGIKFFKPDSKIDKWGNPHQIERELLLQLDAFRSYLGMPVYVTSGYREPENDGKGENGKSQHGYGTAADIVVPGYGGNLLDLFITASRFKFSGIGIYRDWSWDNKIIGGLHVDVRNTNLGYDNLWFCYKDKRGKQIYIPLTVEHLKLHGVL